MNKQNRNIKSAPQKMHLKLRNAEFPAVLLALLLLIFPSCNKDEETGDDDNTSAFSAKVFEYTPAPGQFINDPASGYSASINSPEAAAEFAQTRLNDRKYVSLGAFGGYIVVGFDHKIPANGGYEFGIGSNAFRDSNEPGIVWVMPDDNGNGLPDEEWYQLRGSETGTPNVTEHYSVTYFRPAGDGQPVKWRDSEGTEGEISYLASYHPQDTYYPLWVDNESYTLTGTRLKARNYQHPQTGVWINPAFGWGYADNSGNDDLTESMPKGFGQVTGFKISNAMRSDGRPANLDHIRFVKVQTAIMAESGIIGENSTEVCSFIDLTMILR